MVDCKEKNRIKYDDFLKKEILIIYMLNLGKTNNQILPKILNFRAIMKWFNKQSRIIQVLLLLIPGVNWITEVVVRVTAVFQN